VIAVVTCRGHIGALQVLEHHRLALGSVFPEHPGTTLCPLGCARAFHDQLRGCCVVDRDRGQVIGPPSIQLPAGSNLSTDRLLYPAAKLRVELVGLSALT
jgi:hypothetical protein